MRLIRLIYVSTISAEVAKQDIESIISVSRKNNPENGVTGVLFFNQKYFLQYLEGPRGKVNETYNRIVKDSRHSQVTVLDYKEINARELGDWSMGYAPEYNLTAPVILKYSEASKFSPYEMSGESAYLMLLSLKELVGSE